MRTKSSILILLAFVFLFSSTTFAQRNPQQAQNGLARKSLVATRSGERSCEAKEQSVKTRMTQLTRLAENQKQVFTSITDRVKEFYTTKVTPQGITVANYDTLLADIETKKAAVDTAITNAQTVIDEFSCDSSPLSTFAKFRTSMQATKDALKAYRTSVRNLIQAVHKALPDDTTSSTPTPTP